MTAAVRSDPQVMERMNKELGLDDPVYVRFGNYIAKLATGDLGTSFRTREPVTDLIAKRMWPTLQADLRRHDVCHRDRRAARFHRGAAAGQHRSTRSRWSGGLGPVDGEILARPDADVPVRAEARLAAELRLWRWRPANI